MAWVSGRQKDGKGLEALDSFAISQWRLKDFRTPIPAGGGGMADFRASLKFAGIQIAEQGRSHAQNLHGQERGRGN